MTNFASRVLSTLWIVSILALSSCVLPEPPTTQVQFPIIAVSPSATAVQNSASAAPTIVMPTMPAGFSAADGSRSLNFPADFGAHPDFRTEWWYYTGNLQTANERRFGFELTIFRVSLVAPATAVANASSWATPDLYFAHFTISDISSHQFYAFQRYSRSNPGLAGGQANPYRVWLEDWNVTQRATNVYQLQAEQEQVGLDLTLTDELGVILQGENGYSRKGKNPTNASYYYSQPRLRAEGTVKINSTSYQVSGLVWNDHEFSSGALDESQIGWDWFSLQFEDGSVLMLFQLRERDGGISDSASGTYVNADKTIQPLHKPDFAIAVTDHWTSPHTRGLYPAAWKVHILKPDCSLDVQPWMADQEVNFPPITYWEGAVHFEGTCNGMSVRGNGYVELTGYTGNLPLP